MHDDDSCRHPLPTRDGRPSISYNFGPDRPAEPCYRDYDSRRRPRPKPAREFAARLVDGFALLGYDEDDPS
ncbi:MAG: hypothetical protein L0227_02855 [Chloroflexi bacterium]|nr:hypothetical protein [Chloroflexota bacterium]